MDIKTFTYDLIDSKMYLMIEGQSALVVDPHIEEALFDEFPNLVIEKILLTHEHYDHISGVNWLKEKFGCDVICSQPCAKNITCELRNGSKYFNVLFMDKDKDARDLADQVQPMTCEADITFLSDYKFYWKQHSVMVRETPGHSQGSSCILVDGEYLFTGDSLLKNIPVITKLIGGSKEAYNQITIEYLKGLPEDIYVYPGHGESGWMKEFKLDTV